MIIVLILIVSHTAQATTVIQCPDFELKSETPVNSLLMVSSDEEYIIDKHLLRKFDYILYSNVMFVSKGTQCLVVEESGSKTCFLYQKKPSLDMKKCPEEYDPSQFIEYFDNVLFSPGFNNQTFIKMANSYGEIMNHLNATVLADAMFKPSDLCILSENHVPLASRFYGVEAVILITVTEPVFSLADLISIKPTWNRLSALFIQRVKTSLDLREKSYEHMCRNLANCFYSIEKEQFYPLRLTKKRRIEQKHFSNIFNFESRSLKSVPFGKAIDTYLDKRLQLAANPDYAKDHPVDKDENLKLVLDYFKIVIDNLNKEETQAFIDETLPWIAPIDDELVEKTQMVKLSEALDRFKLLPKTEKIEQKEKAIFTDEEQNSDESDSSQNVVLDEQALLSLYWKKIYGGAAFGMICLSLLLYYLSQKTYSL